MVKVLTTCRVKEKVVLFLEIGRTKIFFYLPAHLFDSVSEYIPFFSKKNITNTQTQTKKQKKLRRKETYKINQRRKGEKTVAVNSICRKSNDTSEFAVKVVFHLQIFFAGIDFFSLQTTKGRALYFSTKKGPVRLVLKA